MTENHDTAVKSQRGPRKARSGGGDGPDAALAARVEAVLLTLDRPVTAARLAEALLPGSERGSADVEGAIERLNSEYERTGRSFRIEKVAGGRRVMTLPEHADALASFHASRADGRLSRAALETLSIVAYRQPMTRAELEAIRGVQCGEVLRNLLERRLISITGRAEEPGRPILYGTSKRFLEVFGLSSLRDLPDAADLKPAGGSR